MKIIDFERKGNVVRFYLGEDNLKDWHGDDWNDRPYDCNAGLVYEEFISGYQDLLVPFDSTVLEPCQTYATNCNWCKDDMKARAIPCIIVVPPEAVGDDYWGTPDNFDYFIGNDKVKRYYFGDKFYPEVL